MEKVFFDLLLQWGPPAGLLLIVLYGAYRLIMYVLDEFKRRDEVQRAESIAREERLASIIDRQADGLQAIANICETGFDHCKSEHRGILESLRR